MLAANFVSKPFTKETDDYKIVVQEKPFFSMGRGQEFAIDSANHKVFQLDIKQYSLRHFLDSLYGRDKYYVNDELIIMQFRSAKGVGEEEMIDILREKYKIIEQ